MEIFLKLLRSFFQSLARHPKDVSVVIIGEPSEAGRARELPVTKVESVDTKQYSFVEQEGKVYTVRDMNVRRQEPSLSAEYFTAPKGKVFSVVGYVTNGEMVNENSIWFKDVDGNYLWSGNVKSQNSSIEKILHSPLKTMICTQEFGERPEVYKNYGSPKGHNGLDFRTWVNGNSFNWKQPVFSVLDGEITQAEYDSIYKGNFVRIKHPNGYESVYLHLSEIGTSKGSKVAAGEEIGISGNSGGASEAPHLHFGYRPVNYDGENGCMGYIDPIPYFVDEITYI